MTNGVTYRTTNLSAWNEKRRGEIELDALARAYLGDAEITDRDRTAFALRELRKRGYDIEACPVDWTKSLMICSVQDAKWGSFGEPLPSTLYRRLDAIAQRSRLITQRDFNRLAVELYPEEHLFNQNDSLEYPYEFTEYRFPPTIQPPPLDPPVMSHPMPIVAGLAELSLVCSGELQVHSRSPVNGGAAG